MAEDAEQLPGVMARRVRTLRQGRAWSLDTLVRRAGVSKGVLVQIEQGQGNPSLTTLIRIADAFGVTVAQLIENAPDEEGPRVVRAGGGPLLWSDDRGSAAHLVASHDDQDHVELWTWRLAPGVEYRSEAHTAGTVELVEVRRGTLRLQLASGDLDLGAGDAARFRGDGPHAYANPGREALVFTMVVIIPAA